MLSCVKSKTKHHLLSSVCQSRQRTHFRRFDLLLLCELELIVIQLPLAKIFSTMPINTSIHPFIHSCIHFSLGSGNSNAFILHKASITKALPISNPDTFSLSLWFHVTFYPNLYFVPSSATSNVSDWPACRWRCWRPRPSWPPGRAGLYRGHPWSRWSSPSGALTANACWCGTEEHQGMLGGLYWSLIHFGEFNEVMLTFF